MGNNELAEILNISEEYRVLDEQKEFISEIVYKAIKDQGLSVNKLAKSIEGLGPAQVLRVLHGEGYNIDTLIKILNLLNLKIDIVEKTEENC